MDYHSKYIEYKARYLQLKIELNSQSGGKKDKLVIHISGPSGSGKTTLGNKLIDMFGKKIIVKDIDDLRQDFIEKYYGKNKNLKHFDKDKYQKWIDDFIDKNTKPIIFVGLNHMPWWHKNHYYNMHSKYNFYIKLDNDTIFKQKCGRFMNDLFVDNKQGVLNDLIKKEDWTLKQIQSGMKNECGFKNTKRMNDTWNKDYRKQGYEFVSGGDIFDKTVKIIKKELSK